jgi:hypothetical protein
MPRHSGNRDGRPIGRIHGCTAGFLRRPRQEVILTAALFAQAECLQVAARSGQRHHRGTANECHGADAPRPHGRCAPSNEMNSRSLMGVFPPAETSGVRLSTFEATPIVHHNKFRRPVSAAGHERPKGDVRVESARLPTADIGRRGP